MTFRYRWYSAADIVDLLNTCFNRHRYFMNDFRYFISWIRGVLVTELSPYSGRHAVFGITGNVNTPWNWPFHRACSMIMFLKYTRFQFPLLDPSWNRISRYATEKRTSKPCVHVYVWMCLSVGLGRIIFGLDERETREKEKGRKETKRIRRAEILINDANHTGGDKLANVKTSVCNWLPS